MEFSQIAPSCSKTFWCSQLLRRKECHLCSLKSHTRHNESDQGLVFCLLGKYEKFYSYNLKAKNDYVGINFRCSLTLLFNSSPPLSREVSSFISILFSMTDTLLLAKTSDLEQGTTSSWPFNQVKTLLTLLYSE